MRIALIGYGHVGRAFAQLLNRQRGAYPFSIVGIHTARHGTAYSGTGLSIEPKFGPPAASVEEFLDRAKTEIVAEITTPNPAAAGVEFRFESTVMDGVPIFNTFRNNLPGLKVLGFTGALNSTSKVVIAAMCEGQSMQAGIEAARRLGITEADVTYDIDGWDSAAKTALLANVLMDTRITPQEVDRRGIGRLTPERVHELAKSRKTVCLVSRAWLGAAGIRVRVRGEVLDDTDPLAAVTGTSNLLLFHTDLMGTIGTAGINSGVEQTAYGLFSDAVDIAKHAPTVQF